MVKNLIIKLLNFSFIITDSNHAFGVVIDLRQHFILNNFGSLKIVSGAKGFEPLNGGTKTRSLTTWRRPIFNFFKIIKII